jgi:hypothetical protein
MEMIPILPPHFEQSDGSPLYTFSISAAQRAPGFLRQRVASTPTVTSSFHPGAVGSSDTAVAAYARWSLERFLYHPS